MIINRAKKSKFILKSKAGFAVLFSIMLASFLITLGISIFSISLKETMITTSVRDSQIAYYAADSARECALYWDVKMGAFPTCLNDDCSDDTKADEVTDIVCNGNTVTVALTQKESVPVYSTGIIIKDFFRASTTAEEVLSARADLRITKSWVEANKSVQTVIETWGHNTGIIGRRVERGIKQTNN